MKKERTAPSDTDDEGILHTAGELTMNNDTKAKCKLGANGLLLIGAVDSKLSVASPELKPVHLARST